MEILIQLEWLARDPLTGASDRATMSNVVEQKKIPSEVLAGVTNIERPQRDVAHVHN